MTWRRLLKSSLIGAGLIMATTGFQCDALESSWGLDAITRMSTPPDPPLVCGVVIPADTRSEDRSSCEFKAGSHASETLGVSAVVSQRIPIRHVIVLMKENRSFDHLFGKLHEQGQAATEAVPPSFMNPDLGGHAISPFHATTTCIPNDPDHQSAAVAECIAGGKMTGFVESAAESTSTSGHFVMSEYETSDLPFYFWLANTFALGDRDFAPMASGTYANRNFLLLGTNAGMVDTFLGFPDPNTPSIFRSLMSAGYTWGVYSDGSPLSGTLDWDSDDPGVYPFQSFIDALDAGTLPNVAFVDGIDNVQDDHPTADLQVGEAWVRNIYEHAAKSPAWPRLAIVYTYDECGAFADHVPPGRGCVARPEDAAFFERGPRVPLVVISPWARRHYVSHVVRDHTAITRMIEAIFDLPALTARDANSDALLDLFDFSCGRGLTAPKAPPAGSGGCL